MMRRNPHTLTVLAEFENSWLPYIITGNQIGRENNKLIRDATVMEAITSDPVYKYLTQDKYGVFP